MTTHGNGLASEILDLLPTDEDVAEYQARGFYLSRKIFTDEEIDAALAGSERFYAGQYEEPPLPGLDRFRPGGDYGSKLRKNDYSTFFVPDLAHLVHHPLIGAIAARLAGTPQIRLWHDQLLYKPMDGEGVKANVGWHTDRGYWKTCSSSNMLTAWIPFHDCTQEMGTITMIDGSQHWPDNTERLDFFMHDLNALEQNFVTGGREVRKIPMNMLKGQVSFHHCLVIHGSGPNFSGQPRRSIAVHLQDASNHYQEYRHGNGSLAHHCNDELARQVNGVPDYADPVLCPVLF